MVQSDRNAVTVFTGRIAGALIALLYVAVVPKLLGPENYGYYSFWFAQLFLLFTLFDFGSSETIRRFLPELIHRSPGQGKDLVRKVFLFKAALMVPALGLVFFYSSRLTFLIIYGASVAAAVSWIFSDMNYAANRMVRYSLYHILRKAVRLLLIVPLFYLLGRTGIIAALSLTEVLILAAFLLMTRGAVPESPPARLEKPFPEYLHFGLLVYTATLLYMTVGRLPVIIARYEGLSFGQIGYLALAIDINYFALRELFYGISEGILPIQAVDRAEGRTEKVVKSFRLTLTYTTAIMLPALIFMWIYADGIIGFVGKKYLPAVPYFRVFLPVVGLNVLAFIYRQVLLIYEHKGAILGASISAFFSFILILFALAPDTLWSLTAAVLGASAVHLLVMRALSRRAVRITGEMSLFLRFIACGGVFAMVLAVGQRFPITVQAVMTAAGLVLFLISLVVTGILGSNEVELARRLWFGEKK